MTDTADPLIKAPRIWRPEPTLPVLKAIGREQIVIRRGTVVENDDDTVTFSTDTALDTGNLVAGTDYAVAVSRSGKPSLVRADDTNPLDAGYLAGFHFAPGGNAEARAGGDDIPAINPFSIWDIGFRPACADPRGMVLIYGNSPVAPFWCDIYLTNTGHQHHGTSRFGEEIADGRSLRLLDFKSATDILAAHGKRMMTYDEFRVATFGVTEKSSVDEDPVRTALDPARTSRIGLMQATGNMWIWGTDGDPDFRRPSLFGGSWLSGSDAGSRCAYLDDWPGLSNDSLGARGACDHLTPA
jgi:hypothetical protein